MCDQTKSTVYLHIIGAILAMYILLTFECVKKTWCDHSNETYSAVRTFTQY